MKIILGILVLVSVVFLIVLIYLLVSPIKVILDSRRGFAMLGWNKWISAKIIKINDRWGFQINLTFWKKWILFKDMKFSLDKKPPKKSPNKKKRRKIGLKKIIKLLKTIRIEEFKWSLDTDDYVLNAYLVPFFEAFSFHSKHYTRINFMGKNELKLYAKGRVVNMLVASIF
jgi:hypothetical protein